MNPKSLFFSVLWPATVVVWLGMAQPAWAQGRQAAVSMPALPEAGQMIEPAARPRLTWQPKLREFGLDRPMRLRGVDAEGSLPVSIRRDQMVESARLRLSYTLSPALLADLSHLKVFFNDQLVQTLVLPKAKLGSTQVAELDINPSYFVDYNQLRFQFIGHYTLECEEPDHSSLWAEINPDSVLELALRPLPLRANLDILPAPFFDERDNRPVVVPIVYAGQPSLGRLKAAGSVASWLGVLAAYRGNRFPIYENELPEGNAIVIATNGARPDFLRELPSVDQPTLSMMEHPRQPGALLLLVLGQDDEQVQRAADALALGKAVLSGRSLLVRQLDYPKPRQPYDAPRWVRTDRPVRLGELVNRPEELQLRGSVLNGMVRVNARMAPDLFTWNTKGIPLDLQYQYTPTPVSDRGLFTVLINNQFVKSYSLRAASDKREKADNVVLPVAIEDPNQALLARSELRIPGFMVGGNNQLQFSFQVPTSQSGRCRSIQPVELRAALSPESTVDLTGFHHYTVMPNLAAFANSGFPFTRHADLAQTTVVLPSHPSKGDVQLYLTALARMSAATGYPGTRFRLIHPVQVTQAADTDILVISEGDRDGLLQRWSSDLPALVAAGKRSMQPVERVLNNFSDLFRMKEGGPAIPDMGQTSLEGDGPLAAVLGMQSPLQTGRSVVALSASDAGSMELIGQSLNDAGKVQLIHGDLALMRGEAIESFRVKPVYYMGQMPWWERLWFHLHSSPGWLALLGAVAGLLLTLLVYVTLQAMARRRLEADHD